MIYTIHNDKISLSVNSLGAEMMSLKTLNDNCEYLWQGDERYWKSRAINLFPICGRLFEAKYTYKGKTYTMNSHGFLRASQMQVSNHTDNGISFVLTDNDITREQYPFSFELNIGYTLNENTVCVGFTVKNTDDKNIIFTLGGHPGFKLPMENDLSFDDYHVCFEQNVAPRSLGFSSTCFLTGESYSFDLGADNSLALTHSLFDEDAIFLENMGSNVTLKSQGEKSIKLTCNDMKYLGLWHTPRSDAPFICIEPWLGIPSYDGRVDDLETKRDMIHLEPQKTFQTEYKIELF